jgi:hypothetical protein
VEGLAAAGITLDPRLVRMDVRGVDAAQRTVRQLLELTDPPPALLAGQNLITIGAIRALQQRGLQQWVALLGFDEFPWRPAQPGRVGHRLGPHQPRAGSGRAAVCAVEGDRGSPRRVVVPTRLVPRGSGEILPHDERAAELAHRNGGSSQTVASPIRLPGSVGWRRVERGRLTWSAVRPPDPRMGAQDHRCRSVRSTYDGPAPTMAAVLRVPSRTSHLASTRS